MNQDHQGARFACIGIGQHDVIDAFEHHYPVPGVIGQGAASEAPGQLVHSPTCGGLSRLASIHAVRERDQGSVGVSQHRQPVMARVMARPLQRIDFKLHEFPRLHVLTPLTPMGYTLFRRARGMPGVHMIFTV